MAERDHLRTVPDGIDPKTGEVQSDEEQRRSLRDIADEAAQYGPGAIAGDEPQLTFGITSPYDLLGSRLKIKGADLAVVGQFAMGAHLVLEVELELGDPSFKRRRDGHGHVTGVERIHSAEIVGWRRVDE